MVVQRACGAPRLTAHAPTTRSHLHRPRGGLQTPGAAELDDQPASTAPTLLRRFKTKAFRGQAAFDPKGRGEPAELRSARPKAAADVSDAGASNRCRHTSRCMRECRCSARHRSVCTAGRIGAPTSARTCTQPLRRPHDISGRPCRAPRAAELLLQRAGRARRASCSQACITM